MTIPVQYSNEGMRVTVNAMIKDPLFIRGRMLRMADKQFIMEALLRKVPNTQSGVVQYEETSPQFADDEPMLVAEGGEIPLGLGQEGKIKAAATIKLARGVEITREQRDRNRYDMVNKRMTQVRNTMVRAWERRMFTLLNTHPDVATVATVGDAWSTQTAKIRNDIMDAIEAVAEAKAGQQGDDDYLGYEPDTLVVSTRTRYNMMLNDLFAKVYEQSPLATKSPIYTGQLERDVLGLTVMVSRFMPDDVAYVMQSKTIGGYSDERPLTISPTYEDRDREVWRANVVRRTAMFLDEPKAAAKIMIAAA